VGFEWDAEKNESNVAKHGIDFADAIRIFDGLVLEQTDRRRDYGETRLIAYGVAMGREIVVVYTIRGKNRRIISARRAHRNERKAYREAYSADAARSN
jgi:uncharacterized DUF497 family protein